MKKKGLIVATIVMVLVLAVSLTTATYAWFTVSNKTTLEDFNITVASNNAVNIGMKKQNLTTPATSNITTNLFWTDAVTYSAGTAGQLGGQWDGTIEGLSNNLTHNIEWGSQTKAVAACTSNTLLSTAGADYTEIGTALAGGTLKQINAANLESISSQNVVTLTTPSAAVANTDGAQTNPKSDYVYMVLGVQPNGSQNLATNNLCIAVDWSNQTGSTIGVLSALHVAYRVTKANTTSEHMPNGVWDGTATTGTWHDEDIFGTTYHYNNGALSSSTNKVTSNITDTANAPAYATAYTNAYAAPGANSTYMYAITGLSVEIGVIDQIELIIYLDGNDGDCVTNGTTNINGQIRLFFCTNMTA